jgi:ribose transport system substrate-binding protein
MRFIRTTAQAAGLALAGSAALAQVPPLEQKDSYVIGFSQTESNNPWRLAETASMEAMAEENGWQIVVTDAAGSAAKQVADVQSLIAQDVDVIVIAPREEIPLVPAVLAAQGAGIPVILVDRNVDQSLAQAGTNYVTFIGSDFIDQGATAAAWLMENFEGESGKIIQLEGTTGSSPANDRAKGFVDAIAADPRFEIVASQSGDFARDLGRQVTETLIQAHPDANVIYAHNDEMAIGAIAALEAAGRTPGEDVTIVSIDGTCDAMQAILDGKMGVTVGSSPFMGPHVAEVIRAYASGETIEPWTKIVDETYTPENASTDPENCF